VARKRNCQRTRHCAHLWQAAYDTIDRATLEDAEEAAEDAQNEYQKVVNDPRKRDWAHDLEKAQEYYDVVKAQYELHAADHTLTIELENTTGDDSLRLNLRPGMTARVEIVVD
jgi:Tfp pilus assembly protein PilF